MQIDWECFNCGKLFASGPTKCPYCGGKSYGRHIPKTSDKQPEHAAAVTHREEPKVEGTESARRQVDKILKTLKEEEAESKKMATVVGVVAFGVLLTKSILFGLFFWTGKQFQWNSLDEWVRSLIFAGLPSFLLGVAIFWIRNFFIERRGRGLYLASFSSSAARLEADSILADLPDVELVGPFNRFNAYSRLRIKLGIITKRFICHACDQRLKFDNEKRCIYCPRCKTNVSLPSNPRCPHCGGRDKVTLLTPEDQVTPLRTGGEATAAGALLYGPAGIISGGIIDSVSGPMKENAHRQGIASKTHLFKCNGCYEEWATKSVPLKA